jgi:predicted nucleic acid-binding protein
MPFVVDASVTLAWFLPDESSEYAAGISQHLESDSMLVPALWPVEVANGLLSAERRGRITVSEAAELGSMISLLPVTVVPTSQQDAMDRVVGLARRERLTAYDAAYLDLAMRQGVSLATQDTELRDAAMRVGVELTTPLAFDDS